MIDVFYEETVNPTDGAKAGSKFKRMKILSWMFLFSGVLFTILFIMFFNMPVIEEVDILTYFLIYLLPLLIFAVISYVFYGILRSKKHRYLTDYDYTFVSGELRIAMVLNGLKRKPVAKIDCTSISVVAKVNSDKFLRYKTMPGVKTIIATPNSEIVSEKLYFMVCTYNSSKSIVIFEPSVNMLINIRKFSPRSAEFAI